MGWKMICAGRSRSGGAVRTSCHLALVGALLLATPYHLSAQPLKLDTCLLLWRQTDAAKSNGLDELMAMGAEGARTRLNKTQLDQIKTHIALIERLKFRCRRFLPPPPGADIP